MTYRKQLAEVLARADRVAAEAQVPMKNTDAADMDMVGGLAAKIIPSNTLS